MVIIHIHLDMYFPECLGVAFSLWSYQKVNSQQCWKKVEKNSDLLLSCALAKKATLEYVTWVIINFTTPYNYACADILQFIRGVGSDGNSIMRQSDSVQGYPD